MRESFGGAFMINLVLVFIVIYISFMAVAINYAKAFRVKNNIINILEQNQYNGKNDVETIEKVEAYLPKVPYNMGGNESIKRNCNNQSEGDPRFIENGVCIVDMSGGSKPKYFKVITYISIDFPFFDIHMTIPISGETKSIYGV